MTKAIDILLGYIKPLMNIITPIVVITLLLVLVFFCTLVMLADYAVKQAKYTHWKKRVDQPSPDNSPDHCRSAAPAASPHYYYHSLSTISEYIPLVNEAPEDYVETVERKQVRDLKGGKGIVD